MKNEVGTHLPPWCCRVIGFMVALAGAICANASDPHTNYWLTTNSAIYARVYKTTSARTSGTTSSTWSGQSSPVYADIQQISYSTTWVYVKSSGLASHVMGPWLNPQGGQFMFWPTNQHDIRRFPRNPVVQNGNKDSTSGGYSGIYINGVAIFNSLDGQAWDGSAIAGQAPHTSLTYYWHRNAPVAEAFNFDGALGHQPPNAIYHTHQNPIALRYQLGDHVDYNSSTKLYSESTTTVTNHSPIVGWAHDGYPIYGPYGYSTTNNAGSGVRRVVSGYVKRDGSNGTDTLASNLSTIPAWYARFRQKLGSAYSTTAATSRPSVNATYTLGTFAEDWAYLGDIGKTQGVDFDLDQYNGRFCVTPEYPSGTYAYFVTIDANGDATYPYVLAYEFYGDATGGSVTSITEPVTTNFVGGASSTFKLGNPVLDTNTVTLAWSAVEGGTYQVQSKDDLGAANWTTNASSLSPSKNSGSYTDTNNVTGRFYRVIRTGISSYDQ